MQRIITNAEIKQILGITGTGQDAVVDLWNGVATQALADELGVSEFAVQEFTDERVKGFAEDYLVVKNFPIDFTEDVTIKDRDRQADTAFADAVFYNDHNEDNVLRVRETAGNAMFFAKGWEYLISYTAGWRVKDVLTVLSLTGLVGKTLTVTIAGVVTTWTIVASGATAGQINIGLDVEATAAAIGTALSGQVTGAVVTLPLGTKVELGTATALQFTILSANIPDTMKMVVALIAGGGMKEKDKSGGVSAYTLGSKQVSFRTGEEADAVKTAVDQWLGYYKKFSFVG